MKQMPSSSTVPRKVDLRCRLLVAAIGVDKSLQIM